MKPILFFISILATLLFTMCNDNKLEIANNGCTPYTDLYFSNYDSLKADPLDVVSINVVGDCLQLKVSYGGCTTDHPINLAYIHPWCGTPPLPPPTFEIKHDSRGELCKMLVTNNLSFDLTPLRNSGEKEVSFIVFWNTQNDSIGSVTLLYEY
jgi:hypothetical protein